MESKFSIDDIYKALEEAEEESKNPNTKYYTHNEIKKIARKVIDGE